MGAREVIDPQSLPAPFGGRMSEGQIGGCFKYGLLQLAYLIFYCLTESLYYQRILLGITKNPGRTS
jgi:hypothetical protein